MTASKRALVSLVALSLGSFGAACTASSDDADRFREALPAQQEIALGLPQGTATRSQGLRVATDSPAAANARWYQFTRDVTAGVDGTAALIVGGVWTIVNSPPTTLEDKRAVWGPGAANALEPAVWRFTVTETGAAQYDYVLEGQARAGGPWLTVLQGRGYGKSRPEHKQGSFTADNDAYKRLEPTRGRDEGTTKFSYDLRALPAVIDVEMRPGEAKGWLDMKVKHESGGAGSIVVSGLADLDPRKSTKLEDVRVVSRWTSTGSGRADIAVKSGDLPLAVDATECWSPSFARVFYKDTVDFEPAAGDASTCAFAAP